MTITNLVSFTKYTFDNMKYSSSTLMFSKKLKLYDKFLSQIQKPGMFVPCDEKNKFLHEPDNYELWLKYGDFTQFGVKLTSICKPYHEAKNSILFKGFHIDYDDESGQDIICNYTNENRHINFSILSLFDEKLTIDDLLYDYIHHTFELTEFAKTLF